jgi:hypothetical protein
MQHNPQHLHALISRTTATSLITGAVTSAQQGE